MHKLFFGLIIICFYLSEPIISKQDFEIEKYRNQSSMLKNGIVQTLSSYVFPNLIPTMPVKNQNWNEYIVISGNNFANNNYRENKENIEI
jgi:hypothetical protein